MKKSLFIFTAALAMSAAAYATGDSRVASSSNNEFGFKLFNAVTKRTEKGNKFLSPLSAYYAFAMLYNGANGDTATELQRSFASTVTRDSFNEANLALLDQLTANRDVTVRVANSLWSRDGFSIRGDFRNAVEQYYRAAARSLDFALPTASGIINGWVNENTNGKIRDIVPAAIPASAVAYLINAAYFEAEWQTKFRSGNTRLADFHVPAGRNGTGTTVRVPTLTRSGSFRIVNSRSVNAVEIPYKGNSTSLVVVMPNNGQTPEQYAATMNDASWQALTATLDAATPTRTELELPKLELKYEETLNEALQRMGVVSAFNRATADLKGISDDPRRLYVSEAKQKTFLKIDEEGTVAAAVTSIEIRTESAIVARPFSVNRPYLFAIRDRATNAVLFLGTIQQPEGGLMPPPRPRGN